jgi:exonuclease VII large subunit
MAKYHSFTDEQDQFRECEAAFSIALMGDLRNGRALTDANIRTATDMLHNMELTARSSPGSEAKLRKYREDLRKAERQLLFAGSAVEPHISIESQQARERLEGNLKQEQENTRLLHGTLQVISQTNDQADQILHELNNQREQISANQKRADVVIGQLHLGRRYINAMLQDSRRFKIICAVVILLVAGGLAYLAVYWIQSHA